MIVSFGKILCTSLILSGLLSGCTQEQIQAQSQTCSSTSERAWWVRMRPLRFSIVQNGKWGFIDQTGKLVIKPQFDYVKYFSEERAAFKSGDKWGFIDGIGQVVVKPQFDDVLPFREQRAAVKIGSSWGFID